jgi:uncharacterized protein (TIGR00730 family)
MSTTGDAHSGYPVEPEDAETSPIAGRPAPTTEDFVRQIKETADKLLRDAATRGDVKLLSTALKELRYSFKVFSAYRDHRKVTVFGSARLKGDHPAYRAAVEFGRRMSQEGFMVITGAASGIMEAGHIGAGRDDSIGINIMLPFEQAANRVIANDPKLMHLKYFFTRKLLFVKETDAVVLFPGGFGTLDEGFEALTLVQTGKSHMFPIVMVDEPGGDYWKQLVGFIEGVVLKRGFISPADRALYKVTDSVEEAVREVTGFYRVYHSMRYVKDTLVLRLKRPISEATLEEIRREFADIVVKGTFELTTAHPFEANEESLRELPRLRFHFDRHGLGRLRMLIDRINNDAPLQ